MPGGKWSSRKDPVRLQQLHSTGRQQRRHSIGHSAQVMATLGRPGCFRNPSRQEEAQGRHCVLSDKGRDRGIIQQTVSAAQQARGLFPTESAQVKLRLQNVQGLLVALCLSPACGDHLH